MLYLDNAATTLQKPPCVIDAMVDAMKLAGNAARGVNAVSLSAARIVTEARQELADYLSVDRSAMSTELGKMKKEGIIDFHKNHFKLLKGQLEE